jgi:methylthioribose-1-phosphate isomerase
MKESSNHSAPNALLESVERLRQAYKELHETRVSAGYLESKLEQCKQLAAKQEKADQEKQRLLELERQNEEMRQIVKQAQFAEKLAIQNRDVREHLQGSLARFELNQSNNRGVFLALFEEWIGRADKPFKMHDYYRMVQRSLKR